MRKLYLKIVAAIWIVMLATTVGVAVIVNTVLPEERHRLRHISPMEMLAGVAEHAVSAAEGSGRAGLVQWFDEHLAGRGNAPPLTLLDGAGNVLAGLRPVDATDGGRARMAAYTFVHERERYRIVSSAPARRVISRNSLFPPLPGNGLRIALRPPSFWLLLLVAVPLSVILSIAIARYLVRPLRAIELAGRRLSEGDLSARVGSALGNRGDEIAEFAAAFDRMAARIEKLVRTHKDLLRDVSHELRSPLARAHAALSLARQRTSGAVDNELDRLEAEIERLDAMIGKLLTFSRLDSGERQIARERIDLAGLLAEVVEDCRFEAEASGKAVRLQAAETPTVTGDPSLLASCFENVIRNALRHTPAGTAVAVSLSSDASSPAACRVEIRDRGRGVPESELPRIFEPFYRVGDSAGSDDGRSGIGLAIAKRAATLHGGTIDARNGAGGGLVVTVLLPASAAGR